MRLCPAVLPLLLGCTPEPHISTPDFSQPPAGAVDMAAPTSGDMPTGMGWQPGQSGTGVTLRGVWVADARLSTVYIAGQNGTLLRGAGTGGFASEKSGTQENLYAVLGVSADEAYAVGGRGTLIHRQAGAWTAEGQALKVVDDLFGLAMPAPGEIYAVGDNGTVLHRSAGAWVRESGTGSPNLRAVWGASKDVVYAVGERTVWARNPKTTAWGPDTYVVNDADQGNNYAITGVDGTVFLAGDYGRVLRRDDKMMQWVPESTVAMMAVQPPTFLGLYGQGGLLLAVGTGGAVQLRGPLTTDAGTMTGWSAEMSGSGADLDAVAGAGIHSVVAVGSGGTVLRRF